MIFVDKRYHPMQIDLPRDIIERVQKRAAAGNGATQAEVIRQALDSLDWQDQERQAIQEGIDAWRAGDYQELHQFRVKNGIPQVDAQMARATVIDSLKLSPPRVLTRHLLHST